MLGALQAFCPSSPYARRLILVRGVRAVGQGAMIVSFTLYLRELGWSAAAIGLLLSAIGLINAALSLFFGALGDKMGPKRLLLLHQSLVGLILLPMLFYSGRFLITVAAFVGNLGRGQNGAAGPFSAVETAWLAGFLHSQERGNAFSLNSAAGFFGMAVGSLLAALQPLWQPLFHGDSAFRPLFLLPILAAIFAVGVLSTVPDIAPKPPIQSPHSTSPSIRIRIQEGLRDFRMLILLSLTNAFNGFAIGMTSPLISYWFAVRYHVGPERIGSAFLFTFLLTGISALLTGHLTQRVGLIRSVVIPRSIGLLLLVLLPLAPTYPLAALLYILRSAFNRGTVGARQAVAIGLIPERWRALGISINNISSSFPSAVGPSLSGWMLQADELALPFYCAACLQGFYLVLYFLLFRHVDNRSNLPNPELT
ncbi:sugar phosphate permease [Chthonomonas calidirosea]|uniref:Sugar phosphate permease n=2 Tax=Chthonomonas TaxID=1077265 RepID=S0ESE0_CHTCT|nr:MFS transporter [Chthonomonas calidirosea]CCW34161.1 Sugar phosphate permease [Chthonomonas calidirosea T49]CEK14424.1 sugar phosphate permease [Chthonomonas calidirosea]CEK15584.1 sugar phosphate permease [Chthonomonas calidirosea]